MCHGVFETLDVDGDLGSPIDMADVPVRNITPLALGFIVEAFVYANILLQFGHPLLLS